ncbi:MAG: hypothetical protein IJA89_02745 [Clostridia bacterium]|nr:hypothetical protein [Clostridia bacterium]
MKNKTKRILATTLCGILTVSSTVFLGSTVEVDEDLERAKELAKGIFMQVEEEQEQPHYYADYMKGLDGEEDYIIVGRHNASGYAVFERSEMELVEYSETGEMPITNTNTSYYAGPANYYVEENEEYKHIGSGEKVDKQKGKEKAKKVKEKIKKIKKGRKEKKEKEKEEKQKEQQEQVEQAQVSGMSYNPLGSSFEQPLSNLLPNGTVTDADEYTVTQRKYISNYEYFYYLTDNGYGTNTDNACASVASQILLSYNNWVNDGRLITQERFFFADRETTRDQPYHASQTGTTNTFYHLIKQKVNPVPGVGTPLATVPLSIQSYLEDYTQVANTINIQYVVFDYLDALHWEINLDRPALASLAYYDYQEDDSILHVVVVYGYQTFLLGGEEVDGFVAHFGWKSCPSDIWVNEDWVNGMMTFQTSHVHTDNILGDNVHIIECGSCGRTKTTEEHTRAYCQYTGRNPNIAAEKVYTHHLEVCACGYQDIKKHVWEYIEHEEGHTKRCQLCQYPLETTPHFFKNEISCWYCGYIANVY